MNELSISGMVTGIEPQTWGASFVLCRDYVRKKVPKRMYLRCMVLSDKQALFLLNNFEDWTPIEVQGALQVEGYDSACPECKRGIRRTGATLVVARLTFPPRGDIPGYYKADRPLPHEEDLLVLVPK